MGRKRLAWLSAGFLAGALFWGSLGGMASGGAEDGARFEYRVVETKPLQHHPDELQTLLNLWGGGGWELVEVLPVADVAILKRQL